MSFYEEEELVVVVVVVLVLVLMMIMMMIMLLSAGAEPSEAIAHNSMIWRRQHLLDVLETIHSVRQTL